ncbi:MAG TPA: pilus assembly protein TadG-related protein [Acidisarcina sp.]|nr:pilus assembly protein TadG-related protein [Acidisarcina sp.]
MRNQAVGHGEEGQAVILVVLAMSIFLLAAVGLGVDGAHIYAQRQMAQTAADAAAQAGIMSIFDSTNNSGAAAFPTSTFTCGTTDAKTPCAYANLNGFGSSTSDTVTIDFPPDTAAPGVAFSAGYPVNLIRATVQRNVDTTLMRLLGATATTVKATAMAGIVDVYSPVPIIINHPSLPSALSLQGNPTVQICGGPPKSIQVNSCSGGACGGGGAAHFGGSAKVDLSKAGPKDDGKCSSGTGADFGVYGYPAPPAPSAISLGTTGHYVQPSSPMKDPLAKVDAPPIPGVTGTQNQTLNAGQGICPATAGPHGCTVLTPGKFPTGISLKDTTALMKPGIYYIQNGGFTCTANCNLTTVTGFVDGPTGTNTGWDGTALNGGVLIYNTGVGQINIGANGSTYLIGSPDSSIYKGILFFQDHTSGANTGSKAHSLGGGGAMTLIGTLYLTNTRDTMLTAPTHYQEVDVWGNSGSGTLIQGEIIVDVLQLGGGGTIQMNLDPFPSAIVSEVALVN